MGDALERKLKVIRMYTDLKEFNYEPPQMSYDKATGEIRIQEKKVEKKEKKIITNMDEM